MKRVYVWDEKAETFVFLREDPVSYGDIIKAEAAEAKRKKEEHDRLAFPGTRL